MLEAQRSSEYRYYNRDREREREREICICICIYIYVCIYIHTYISKMINGHVFIMMHSIWDYTKPQAGPLCPQLVVP